jgi:antibiotic biosynthesis monooxygenase (ABM) superfamily enzyme
VVVAALAVASIYVWGRAFLANVALVVEDAAVFRSLGISWSLIKGHWWRTATVYSVALLIVMVFYVVIIMADGIVGVALRGSLAAATILSQLVFILGGSFLMSFVPAVLLSTYYDLKLRKEGSDLADRVNALAPQ